MFAKYLPNKLKETLGGCQEGNAPAESSRFQRTVPNSVRPSAPLPNDRLASLQGIRSPGGVGPFSKPGRRAQKKTVPFSLRFPQAPGCQSPTKAWRKLDEHREGRSSVEEPCVQPRRLPKPCGDQKPDAALSRRLSPSESASKGLSPTRSARRHPCRMSAWHPFKGFGALEASGPFPSPDAALRKRLSPSHCDCHKLLGVNPQGLGETRRASRGTIQRRRTLRSTTAPAETVEGTRIGCRPQKKTVPI